METVYLPGGSNTYNPTDCPPGVSSSINQLISDLRSLVNDRRMADIVFIVGSEAVHFYAHKLIIWTRCHNFRQYKQQSGFSTGNPVTFRYEHYDPGEFENLLQYIYTGQITLQDGAVFSFIQMACEFGLPELVSSCERYISQNININNACLYLGAVFELDNTNQDMLSQCCPRIAEACFRFLERHAEKCISTDGWLELPKPAIIRLISSQQFSLDEDNIWKAVMRWAKHQTGVDLDKPADLWTEQERSWISQVLDGVIEHIKVLLISSQLFAQEVEPTGLVSMETVLERYRLAAVTLPRGQITDDRLKPRLQQQYFIDTTILISECYQYQILLNKWCNLNEQQWQLLYRASRDGYSSQAFHKHCDNRAPTIVIVKGASGCICGGYSDVPWTNKTPARGRYLPSHRSFIFTLVNNQDVPPMKFDVTKSVLATLHHPNYGPIFGGGADLCIADNCNLGMQSYSNFPHSYHGNRSLCSILMGDYSFVVSDYEVFSPADELL